MIYVNQYQKENVFLDLSLSHFYNSIQNHKKWKKKVIKSGPPLNCTEREREQLEMEEIVNNKII